MNSILILFAFVLSLNFAFFKIIRKTAPEHVLCIRYYNPKFEKLTFRSFFLRTITKYSRVNRYNNHFTRQFYHVDVTGPYSLINLLNVLPSYKLSYNVHIMHVF